MTYKTRPGIVLLKICDTFLLIAKREIWETCPRIRPIPMSWAGCWTIMKNGKTNEEAIKSFSDLFHKPEELFQKRYEKMFETLYLEGYLIESEEAKDDKD